MTEVLKMVRSGYRLEKPACCPDIVFKLLMATWNIDRHERPTFAKLGETLQKM